MTSMDRTFKLDTALNLDHIFDTAQNESIEAGWKIAIKIQHFCGPISKFKY